MAMVLKGIMGSEYDLVVTGDHSFSVLCNGHIIRTRQTLRLIAPHWKVEIREMIMKLVNDKINNLIKSNDN